MSGVINEPEITHSIFDLDGLILDTETLAFKVTQNILDQLTNNTKKHSWEVKESLLGLSSEDVAKKVVQVYDLPVSWQKYRTMANEEAQIMMKNCEIFEGAERLICHLFNNNIPICVATSSTAESFRIKTENHRAIFKLFDFVLTGGSDKEVKRGKPHPDIFLIAANRFKDKPKPENCLVFEDSPCGVKAALAAGMHVVAVPDDRVSKTKLVGASAIIQSLADFQPEMFGLSAFIEE